MVSTIAYIPKFGGSMQFLTGLMTITFLGIAFPVILLVFLGICFLGVTSYKEDLLAWKTFFGVVCFVAIGHLTNFDWFGNIFSLWTLAYIAGWALMGAIWFLFKWNQFVGKKRAAGDAALKEKMKHPLRNDGEEMTPEEKRMFMLDYKPRLDEHKERAFSWIILWPFSVLAYVFGDLIRGVADWIIERLRGAASRITARHFGEFERPMEENKAGK